MFPLLSLSSSVSTSVTEQLCFQGEPYKLHEWVEVLPTPGHTGSDVSVVVRNTSIGTIVVAGMSRQGFAVRGL